VTTHEHTKRIPVLANSQDMSALSDELRRAFAAEPDMHGFLLAGHGLYTWGADLAEARRHLEVLEFLFEVTARLELSPSHAASLY
jgi:methylthioribulose-1-phosphate dehydratase